MRKYELLSILFIFIISAISVFDFFVSFGRPATFDAPTHMTDIAGYSQALIDKNFPVLWLDKFGNYGMPIGLFSHQLVLTLAGSVNIFVHNPVFIFYTFFFLGIFLTNIIFYRFLRIYFPIFSSLAGIMLLTFSAYRITNIYVRGDLPETFSGIFLGTILLGIYYFIQKNKTWGFFCIAASYFCLVITHPLMLVTYSFLVFPYLLYVLLAKSGVTHIRDMQKIVQWSTIKFALFFVFAMVIGIAMAMYFLLPLVVETKYLYFGQQKNHLSLQFLSFKNFFSETWLYFYHTDIFTRGQFIQIGSFEFLVCIAGLILFLKSIAQKTTHEILHLHTVALVSGGAIIFMTTIFALPLYIHIPFLSSLQFPWRMLSVFIFIPPIIAASLFTRIRANIIIVLGFILLVALVRFPQLYGKNYTVVPLESYYFTPYNLFPIDMNTIWTGKTEDYPIEKQKIGIIQGSGKILSKNVQNASRIYIVDAKTQMRLVDYTFYFPGWNVYVDGQHTAIEFQDPAYRGVITYMVPPGQHTIHIVLQDTAIRKVGKIVSLLFISLFVLLLFTRRKIFRYIKI